MIETWECPNCGHLCTEYDFEVHNSTASMLCELCHTYWFPVYTLKELDSICVECGTGLYNTHIRTKNGYTVSDAGHLVYECMQCGTQYLIKDDDQ